MLEVYLPYTKKHITQRFGQNANISYARSKLDGHTAYDWGVPYGTLIPNCTENAYCYSTLNATNPDLMKYRAAYFIVEDGDSVYEISYGHMALVLAKIGETYQPGAIIGTVGNTGTVFSGSHEVTREQKLKGSKAGAHLHGPQVRPVKKVTRRYNNRKYLMDSSGFFKKDGYFYEIPDYNNGYNGCISLAPFSTETIAFLWKPKKDPVEGILDSVEDFVEVVVELPVEQRTGPLRALQKIVEGIWEYLQGKK